MEKRNIWPQCMIYKFIFIFVKIRIININHNLLFLVSFNRQKLLCLSKSGLWDYLCVCVCVCVCACVKCQLYAYTLMLRKLWYSFYLTDFSKINSLNSDEWHQKYHIWLRTNHLLNLSSWFTFSLKMS